MSSLHCSAAIMTAYTVCLNYLKNPSACREEKKTGTFYFHIWSTNHQRNVWFLLGCNKWHKENIRFLKPKCTFCHFILQGNIFVCFHIHFDDKLKTHYFFLNRYASNTVKTSVSFTYCILQQHTNMITNVRIKIKFQHFFFFKSTIACHDPVFWRPWLNC